MPSHISTVEAARILRVSTRTVLRRIRAGRLPAVRMGLRAWAVDRAAVEKARTPS